MKKFTVSVPLFSLVLVSLSLPSCNSETEEPAETNAPKTVANDIATIELQPILYPDIEANDLYGASCAYASGNSIAALVIAMQGAAFIKSGGEIITLSAKAASEELPYGSRAVYFNKDHTLRLKIEGEGEQDSPEVINYQGTAVLTDSNGGELQRFSGTAQCGV